jgi:hypothetical protein
MGDSKKPRLKTPQVQIVDDGDIPQARAPQKTPEKRP